MTNTIEHIHELSILDEKLISFLDLDDEVNEINLIINFEIEEDFASYVPYGDTWAKLCDDCIDVSVFSVLAHIDNKNIEIKDLIDKSTLE